MKIEQTSQGTPNSWPHLLSSQAPANSNTTPLPVGEIGLRQDASKEDMEMSGSSASKLGTSKHQMDGDGHCSSHGGLRSHGGPPNHPVVINDHDHDLV